VCWSRWFVLASTIGCASIEIAPGERPAIAPTEGVLVFGIEAQNLIYMNVVGRGEAASFTINPIYVGSNLRVYHVPAGEYCVQQLTFSTSTSLFDPEPCFEVRPGAITLTGFVEADEVVSRPATEEEVWSRFEGQHPELARAFTEKRFVEIAIPNARGVPLD
jgi:hypothetical protein